MLDLNHIELATDEDKAYGIDHWAKLFKGKNISESHIQAIIKQSQSNQSQE